MLQYNNCPPGGKPDHENIDDDATELAVLLVAGRFNLPLNVARLIARHADLGSNEDRAGAGGGKAA
jgi:hypothetical protein